jgi:hypothetical protein
MNEALGAIVDNKAIVAMLQHTTYTQETAMVTRKR